MPKKTSVKKKGVKHRTSKSKISVPKNQSDINIEKVLVENFVSLQKVMTNLSLRFDNLTTQISQLLELFEISAKTLAKKDFEMISGKKDQEMIKKMDNLLEQNKIIARGLTLLHEPDFKQPPQPPEIQQNPQLSGVQQTPQAQMKPMQQIPAQVQKPKEDSSLVDIRGYQRSMPLRNSSNSPLRPTKKQESPKDLS